MTTDDSVTALVRRWQAGEPGALDALWPQVYGQLRALAGRQLRRERDGVATWQPTALVHEAWLRLLGGVATPLRDRDHLLALAGRVMRQVLVDHARARKADKRDGGERVTLSGLGLATPGPDIDLLALDQALAGLEAIDPRKARVVELRVFAGLEFAAIGELLGASRATLDRDFRAARAWLFRALQDGGPPAPAP